MARAIPTEQYIKGVEAKLRKIKELDKELTRTVSAIHSNHAQYIFGSGMDGTSYSTKPILVGSNVLGNRNAYGGSSYSFVNQKPKVKYFGSKKKIESLDWRTVGTPKGPRPLALIQGGYKQIRTDEGKQTRKVDLNRSGVLFKDFSGPPVKSGDLDWVVGVKRAENVGKLEGAIKRYGRKLEVPDRILDKYRPLFGRIMVKFITI